MIDAGDLRKYVIEPTLKKLAEWHPRINSESAIRLLLMTAAHESTARGVTRLHQIRGPAVGIFQMEPATMEDLFDWISRDNSLRGLLVQIRTHGFPLTMENEMAGNLYFACAMARLNYWRKPAPLPEPDDIWGLAAYAKRWWNTHAGKATVADYHDAYHDLWA